MRRLTRLVPRVVVLLLLAAAGLVLFPPTFRSAATLLIRNEARARGADFSVRVVTGSVFDPLTFQDVRVTRKSPAQVETVARVGQAVMTVSLRNLVLNGGRPWLERLDLDGVDIDVRIGAGKPGKPALLPSPKWPPLLRRPLPSAIEARRVNCTFTRNGDSLRIEGMSLSAGDLATGRVGIARAEVRHPLLRREFHRVTGRAALQDGRIEIADLRLDEGFVFRNIITSLSGWAAGAARIEFNALAFTGELRGNLVTVPENAPLQIEAAATFNNIAIGPLAAFLGSKARAGGLIRSGKLTYRGSPHEMEKATVSTRLEAVNFRWGDRQWDELVVGATFVNRRVRIPEFTLRQARNTLTADGELTIPGQGAAWWATDFSLNIDADLRDLSALSALAGPGLADATGGLRARGALQCASGGYGGQIDVSGTGLTFRKAPVRSLRATLALNGTEMQIQQLELLNGDDFVRGKGFVNLATGNSYSGELHASVADLKTYAPLHGPPFFRHSHGGGMLLDWSGDGSRTAHSGSFKLLLKKLRQLDSPDAGGDALDADAEGTYSPGNVFLSRCEIARDGQRASAKVIVSPESVRLDNLLVQPAQDAALKGDAILPLDIWSKWPEMRVVPDGALKLHLDGDGLPLDRLHNLIGKDSPIDGMLAILIDAEGTAGKLAGSGTATLTRAGSGQGPRLSATLTLDKEALRLTATALPLRLSPTISATADLDAALTQPLATAGVSGTMRLASLQAQRRIPLDTLLETDAEISLPTLGWACKAAAGWNLDLACVTAAPLQITGQSGTVEADLRMGGPAGSPHLSGRLALQGLELASPSADVKINTATLAWPATPPGSPALEASASGNTGTLKISARVIGTAAKRTLVLESEPPLPVPEILARLRGKPSPAFDPAPLLLNP
jgi:hypothetical protein